MPVFLEPCTLGAGPGSLRPMITGVETVLAIGIPTPPSNETSSSDPISTACSPNEVSVVQLRREYWPQEGSSKLSANMVSSRINLFAAMDTTPNPPGAFRQRNKAAFSRSLLGTFPTLEVSFYCF